MVNLENLILRIWRWIVRKFGGGKPVPRIEIRPLSRLAPSPGIYPPIIFGRETTRSHRQLITVCEDLLKAPSSPITANDRAFAWNLLHDHRVSENWAEIWFNTFHRPADKPALQRAFREYFRRFLNDPMTAYADLSDPAGNAVTSSVTGAPQPSVLLTSILDLWSLQAQRIWNFGVLNFSGRIPLSTDDIQNAGTRLPGKLARILESGTIDGQQALMAAFFDAQRGLLQTIDENRRKQLPVDTFNPLWVTLNHEWTQRAGSNANQWCESVGLSMKPDRTPAWLAVVTYPMYRAKRLYRPTQLEGGWYGRHFPSPPGCPLPRGGRVVEGRDSVFEQPGYLPLPEYIHYPIPLFIEDWLVNRMPVMSTVTPPGEPLNLERDRTGHYHGLGNRFHDLKTWMDRPNP